MPEKMAANNQVTWRSPLSFCFRDNDCFEPEQSDLFQNLEKLVASAVSICRLDGSLQCQIGGLITVIEELQRLLRHSFSEVRRLEKTLDNQKLNFSNKISDLHKQVKDLESIVNAYKCIQSHAITSQVPIAQEDTGTCMTPRSSLDDEKYFFQAEKNGSQTDEREMCNVSLVDESYGNEEESDASVSNNLNDQPDEIENVQVTTLHSGDQLTDVDPTTKDVNVEGDQAEHLLNVVESSQETLKKQVEDGFQENDDTFRVNNDAFQVNDDAFPVLTNDQTAKIPTEERSANTTEESGTTSRNLRNSKLSLESKIQGRNITRSQNQGRSGSPVKSPRMNLKSNVKKLVDKRNAVLSAQKARRAKNEITVKRPGRKPKQLSKNDRSIIKSSREDRIGMKTVSEKAKGSIKLKITQRKRTPKDVKTRLAGMKIQKKSNGSKNHLGKVKIMNRTKSKDSVVTKVSATFKETNGKTNVNFSQTKSTSPPVQEKPLDRYINLDFLLSANQVMSDLVLNGDREEAALDQVKETQRKHVMNLAKLYRLRVRMAGKCEGEFPVVLVKGRESCLPKPGEVDGLLSTMSDTLANEKPAGLPKRSGNKHKIDEETNNSSLHQNFSGKSKKKRVQTLKT